MTCLYLIMMLNIFCTETFIKIHPHEVISFYVHILIGYQFITTNFIDFIIVTALIHLRFKIIMTLKHFLRWMLYISRLTCLYCRKKIMMNRLIVLRWLETWNWIEISQWLMVKYCWLDKLGMRSGFILHLRLIQSSWKVRIVQYSHLFISYCICPCMSLWGIVKSNS